MLQQPNEDTRPELLLRRELHRRGLRYRLHRRIVPGAGRRRVDIVFARAKVAVYVDGCFWHACPRHGRTEHVTNEAYWSAKMARNRARDQDSTARLRRAGWKVVRVWEHEEPKRAAARVEKAVRERLAECQTRRESA